MLWFYTLPSFSILFLLAVLAWRSRKHQGVDVSLLLTNLVFALLFTVYYRTTFFWAPIAVFSLLFLLSRQKNGFCQQLTCGLATALACLIIGAGALYYKVYEAPVYSAFGPGYGIIAPIREAEYIARYFPGERLGNTYMSAPILPGGSGHQTW